MASGPLLPSALDAWQQGVYSPIDLMFEHAVPAGAFLSVVIADGHGRLNTVTSVTDSKGNTYEIDGGATEANGDGTLYVAHSVLDHAIEIEDQLLVHFLSDVPPYASGPDSALHDGIWKSVHITATGFSDVIDSFDAASPCRGIDGERGPSAVTLTVTPRPGDPSGLTPEQPDLLIAYFVCERDGANDTGNNWRQFLHTTDPDPGPPANNFGDGTTPNDLFGSWQLVTAPGSVSYTVGTSDETSDDAYGAAIVLAYAYGEVVALIPGTIVAGPGTAGETRWIATHGAAGHALAAAIQAAGQGKSWDIQGLVQLALSVGVSGDNAAVAAAVAMAESSGDETNVSYNPGPPESWDRGLWQINSYYHPEVSDACAFDPQCNARAMSTISSGGTNWTPWATFNSGAYLTYLPAAQAALASIAAGGSNSATSGSSGQIRVG